MRRAADTPSTIRACSHVIQQAQAVRHEAEQDVATDEPSLREIDYGIISSCMSATLSSCFLTDPVVRSRTIHDQGPDLETR